MTGSRMQLCAVNFDYLKLLNVKIWSLDADIKIAGCVDSFKLTRSVYRQLTPRPSLFTI